jgi:hypothetical protein
LCALHAAIEDSNDLEYLRKREKQINDKPTKEEQKAKDWARYQAAKKEHYLHNSCTAEQCVLECLYFPEDGYMTEDGNIHYEDSNLDPSFMGTYGALEARNSSNVTQRISKL